MKTVTRIETFDGDTHPTRRDAQKHLDNLFGTLLCAMARKVVELQKYADVLAYLETQTETMRQLVQIKDDMTLEDVEE